MAKRTADSADESPYRKRQKLTVSRAANLEKREIKTVQDLKSCLSFNQDDGPEISGQNIKSFKAFLDSLAYGEDESDRLHKRTLLFKYLDTGVSSVDTKDVGHLSNLLQAWSFAAHSKSEGFYCSITAVLALLLKTTSNHIEFRDHGNDLCNTLLQEDHVHLLEWGLSSIKLKDHVISPCLRLLTEIVLYDGGAAAKALFTRRESTFKRLEVFLLMRHESANLTWEGQQKPSVRKNALRYLFANLKLQNQVAKTYLVTQGRVIQAVFQEIKEDPPSIVHEILEMFKKYVLLDQALSRVTKSLVFTDWILTRIAMLYDYQEKDDGVNQLLNIQDLAHSFLLRICTVADHGVLLTQIEAPLSEIFDLKSHGSQHELELELATKKLLKQKSVKNVTLASFLQGLRPYANVMQNELVVSIFQAAPELVADYFSKKKSFYFEPKLTATWVGYSMFLLSSIQLPIDGEHLRIWSRGYSLVPPPLYVLMESILPSPLTKKAITRCLNQSTMLITFFAIRILIAAFQKLEQTLKLLVATSQRFEGQALSLWKQTILKLKLEFGKRCPEMSHVIKIFRCCPRENSLLKEASVRLLATYYQILPQLALKEKFDISATISVAFGDYKSTSKSCKSMNLQGLEHLSILKIALFSPDLRWWHKTGTTSLSPFTTVLKFHVANHEALPSNKVGTILQQALDDIGFSIPNTTVSSLEVLVSSLRRSGQWEAEASLFEYLDGCLVRLAKKPVKYYDDLVAIIYEIGSDDVDVKTCSIGLFLTAILEQWPFLVKSASSKNLQNVSGWLTRYLGFCMQAGENLIVLSYFRNQIQELVSDAKARSLLQTPLAEPEQLPLIRISSVLDDVDKRKAKDLTTLISQPETTRAQPETTGTGIPLEPSPVEVHDERCLTRWTKKDIGQATLDGDVGALVLCLCSKYEEVRKHALSNLRIILGKLEKSHYSEWQQTYVLLGEVTDAAISQSPLPYFAGVLAARFLMVLSDPLHVLYTKVNKFLNRTPRWDLAKLPSYWVDRILLHPPDDDYAFYQEVEWLLDALTDGLRTPNDMETYRRCYIFERLLSMSASPSMPKSCMGKLIALLYRCTYVGGGSTLITRCGLLSWIDSRVNARNTLPSGVVALKNLAQRAHDTSEKGRVDEWSGGAVKALLDNLPIETVNRVEFSVVESKT